MNIGIDSVAIKGSKDRGIGKYTASQINAMTEMYPSDTFYYFNYFGEPHVGKYIEKRNNLHELMIYSGPDYEIVLDDRCANIFGTILNNYFEKYCIDVFYMTSFTAWDRLSYKKKYFSSVITCATFYDLIPYLFKEAYLPSEFNRRYYYAQVENLRWVDHLFSISESAKNDICDKLLFDENKVTVMYGAADKSFKKEDVDTDRKKAILEKFNINMDFIISVLGEDERKNVPRLIRSYASGDNEEFTQYQLVIVCKLSNKAEDRFKKLIKEFNAEQNIILTNFVTDEELKDLYSLAYASVFVPVYEGLGLPVLEAYAHDLPVVTSNNSSLVEVAGDAAIMVDPYKEESIRDGILKLLTLNPEERAGRIKKGHDMYDLFNWDRTAAIAMDRMHCLSNCSRKNPSEMRLAIFSPIVFIDSDTVANDISFIEKIAKRFKEVDVFVGEGITSIISVPDNVNVLLHTAFDAANYDGIFYQFCNNIKYDYMIEYIQEFPGTVELLEYNLNHILMEKYLFGVDSDWETYGGYLLEDYSEEDAKSIVKYEKTMGEPSSEVVNGFITKYAKRIIVHDIKSKEAILKLHMDVDVSVVSLGKSDKKSEYSSDIIDKFEKIICSRSSIYYSEKDIKYFSNKYWNTYSDEEKAEFVNELCASL